MTASEAQTPFIKNLASSDRKLRESSLDSLSSYLSSLPTLPLLSAQKLWKGLYYALYMTDRPAPQQRLATSLALLSPSAKGDNLKNWYEAFWNVLGERWPYIDALRMDKFLFLVRKVFAQMVRLARNGDEGVERVLGGYAFEEEGDLRKVPLGLRLHVMDIWLDELEKEGLLGEEAEGGEFVKRVGKMVRKLERSPIKQVRERAREGGEDGRLPWNEKTEEERDDEWGGIDD